MSVPFWSLSSTCDKRVTVYYAKDDDMIYAKEYRKMLCFRDDKNHIYLFKFQNEYSFYTKEPFRE